MDRWRDKIVFEATELQFHSNKELEQYLRIYIDHRQNNQLKWLATANFAFNNKIHTAMKLLLFKINYKREPRISFNIRKKKKHVKVEEFVREIKSKHKEIKAALIKSQEEIKRYIDRNRKEAEEYKVKDKVLISIKDFSMELMKRATKKLMEKYIGLYIVKKIILENVLQTSFSLYLHNQWTDFHKLSCAGKPQMKVICTYAGNTKATTND